MKHIIIAFITLVMLSCNEGMTESERVALGYTDTVTKHPVTLQVMHLDSSMEGNEHAQLDYGRVENIKDELNMLPHKGDTLVILDSDVLLNKRDSNVISSYRIWGKYKGYVPENLVNDSTWIFYHKVVVVKYILP